MRPGPTIVCALAAGLASVPAEAKIGRCLLEVGGRTFLDGQCEIVMEDGRGSFAIGVGATRRAKYFAYVTMEEDGAHGYWNATPDATHAHAGLGILKREGACWTNSTARVCAYR